MNGICTLANDKVFDQVVALLNSIEVYQGVEMPVCIYPYDDNIERLSAEVATRPQVQIYDDRTSINYWDQFYRDIWQAHPTANQQFLERGHTSDYHFGHHRLFCAFDGPFDRFLYIDADVVLMNSVDHIFEKLNNYDWVVYDFQYKDISHVYDVKSQVINNLFSPSQLKNSLFCSGFYASSKGIFNHETAQELLKKLKAGEAEVLYVWSSDQPVLNYMVMRSNLRVYNLALNLPDTEVTGNSVTSSHFENRNHIMYDQNRRLTYLHYIGISSKVFHQVCTGENIDFPYRDIFLHYRYLHEPEKQPQFTSKPRPYNQPPSLLKRTLKKLKLAK